MGQRVANLLPAALVCAAITIAPPVLADFTFDFTPSPEGERLTYEHVFCSIEGQLNHNCGGTLQTSPISQTQWYRTGAMGNDFASRFFQEVVTIDGVDYFHLAIGSPEEGFTQEVYIAKSPHFWRSNSGVVFSDSGGVGCLPYSGTREERIACLESNNASDPLGDDSNFSGNGTGNPSNMVMIQTITDDEEGFTQEFFKTDLALKPIITQLSDDAEMNARFVMDMSNSDYDTNDTPGIMTNTLDLKGLPAEMGDYEFGGRNFAATEAPKITAGTYTFRRFIIEDFPLKEGYWTRDIPSSEYVYADGTIDPVLNVNWESFRDPGQNPRNLFDFD